MSDNTLPPGQVETRKFPLVGEKIAPAAALDPSRWRLVVEGRVRRPFALTLDEVRAFPREQRRVDIHCVTGWSQFAMTFEGFPLARLLERSEPLPDARFIRFEAYSDRRHDTSLPLELAREDTWLVHGVDGQPLTPEHGFPLRTLTPSRYFFKSLKWLHRIELLTEDRLGFWERNSSYHNEADPWAGDQRFTTGSLEPQKLERFRSARSFDRWRGERKVMIGLDLRDWEPLDRDLRELHLKSCDLSGARLAGVDLRHANLSLCNLRGADLRGANLYGADVEGADFVDADLRDVDLRDSYLSATRFVEVVDGAQHAARVEGMRWSGAHGVIEDQEAFLLAQGGDVAK